MRHSSTHSNSRLPVPSSSISSRVGRRDSGKAEMLSEHSSGFGWTLGFRVALDIFFALPPLLEGLRLNEWRKAGGVVAGTVCSSVRRCLSVELYHIILRIISFQSSSFFSVISWQRGHVRRRSCGRTGQPGDQTVRQWFIIINGASEASGDWGILLGGVQYPRRGVRRRLFIGNGCSFCRYLLTRRAFSRVNARH